MLYKVLKVILAAFNLNVLNCVGHVGPVSNSNEWNLRAIVVGQTRGSFSWVELMDHSRGSNSWVKLLCHSLGYSRGSSSWVKIVDHPW